MTRKRSMTSKHVIYQRTPKRAIQHQTTKTSTRLGWLSTYDTGLSIAGSAQKLSGLHQRKENIYFIYKQTILIKELHFITSSFVLFRSTYIIILQSDARKSHRLTAFTNRHLAWYAFNHLICIYLSRSYLDRSLQPHKPWTGGRKTRLAQTPLDGHLDNDAIGSYQSTSLKDNDA